MEKNKPFVSIPTLLDWHLEPTLEMSLPRVLCSMWDCWGLSCCIICANDRSVCISGDPFCFSCALFWCHEKTAYNLSVVQPRELESITVYLAPCLQVCWYFLLTAQHWIIVCVFAFPTPEAYLDWSPNFTTFILMEKAIVYVESIERKKRKLSLVCSRSPQCFPLNCPSYQ